MLKTCASIFSFWSWAILNICYKKLQIPPFESGGTHHSTNLEEGEIFADSFQTQYSPNPSCAGQPIYCSHFRQGFCYHRFAKEPKGTRSGRYRQKKNLNSIIFCTIIMIHDETEPFSHSWKHATIICNGINSWKHATKVGKLLHLPSSYRPISLLSSLSKVSVREVLKRMKEFNEQYNLFRTF